MTNIFPIGRRVGWLPFLAIGFVLISHVLCGPPPIKPHFPSLDDCRNKIKSQDKDIAMHFSKLGQWYSVGIAKGYAVDHGLTHVTNQYPDKFCNQDQYQGSKKQLKQFQSAFSQAYAERSTGITYLMMDKGKVPSTGNIFQSVELEAIKKGGRSATDDYWSKDPNKLPYAPGTCAFHLTQYQKPDPDKDHYKFNVTIIDDFQIQICRQTGLEIATAKTGDILSALPYVLEVTAGAIDKDPVGFKYNDLTWNSDDDRCKFGG